MLDAADAPVPDPDNDPGTLRPPGGGDDIGAIELQRDSIFTDGFDG